MASSANNQEEGTILQVPAANDDDDDDDDNNKKPPARIKPRQEVIEIDRDSTKRPSQQRPSHHWLHQHFSTLQDGSKQCLTCGLTFSKKTATGPRKAHLEKHGITEDTSPSKKPKVQPTLHFLQTPKALDSAVTEYIVGAELGHQHVEIPSFIKFVAKMAPSYKVMSRRTLRRILLEMYAVLKALLINYFASHSNKVSLTFDGWTNDSMKGFYSVTLHFVDPHSFELQSCLIDFFHVVPGTGVSGRVADHLEGMLKQFGLWTRLLAVVSDNGSDAKAAARLLTEKPASTLTKQNCCRCIVHSLDLGVKAAFDEIQKTLGQLRLVLTALRNGKVRREKFRTKSQLVSEDNRGREPPCIDCKTRWSSTYNMLVEALQFKDVIKSVCLQEPSLYISDEMWAEAKDICAVLKTPAIINQKLGGEKFCTMSISILAQEALKRHCLRFQNHPSTTVQNTVRAIMKNADDYRSVLATEAAAVATFLDRTMKKPTEDEAEFVRAILDMMYPVEEVPMVTEMPISPEHQDSEFSEFTSLHALAGTTKPTATVDEIEKFGREDQLPEETDIIGWWKTRAPVYPRLSKMAMDYLAVPASSVPAERANSEAKRIFDGRLSLTPITFKAEMCVRSWLDVLPQLGVALPSDYRKACRDMTTTLQDMTEDEIVEQALKKEAP
jgi:hAT family C-terminal dimerisation region